MNVTADLKAAIRAVRANPDAVAALDAEEAEKAKAAATEVKRRAELAAKVAAAIPDRAAALAEDYLRLDAEALTAAAQALAREQLERETGFVPLNVAAQYPAPARLSRTRFDAAWSRLAGIAPVPWDRKHRAANQLQSDTARATADELARPAREAREAETRRQAETVETRERDRAAKIEAHKRAGIGK